MVRTFKSLALVGAFMMAASPVFAQGMDLPVIGNIDLDPMHILSPAPAAAPAAAPMKMHHHHHMMKHHKMMHHHKMMKHKNCLLYTSPASRRPAVAVAPDARAAQAAGI